MLRLDVTHSKTVVSQFVRVYRLNLTPDYAFFRFSVNSRPVYWTEYSRNSRVAISSDEVSRCWTQFLALPVIVAARRWLRLTTRCDFLLLFYSDLRSSRLDPLSSCNTLNSAELSSRRTRRRSSRLCRYSFCKNSFILRCLFHFFFVIVNFSVWFVFLVFFLFFFSTFVICCFY